MRVLVVVLAVASCGIFALLIDELRKPMHAPATPAASTYPATGRSNQATPRPTPMAAPTRTATGSAPHSSLAAPIDAAPKTSPVALSTWRGPSVFGNLPSTPLDEEPPRPVPAYVIVDGPRIIDHGDGSRVIITSSELEVYY